MPRPEREPKPMADLLRVLVAGRGWGERLALGRLREAWPSVVGPLVAAHSEPVRLVRGTLTVRAEAGPWATELTLLSRTVAEKVSGFLGGDPVRDVRVVADGSRER